MRDFPLEVIPAILAACFVVVFLVLYLWSVIWAMGDAESRGKPGCLVGLFVALFSWPMGLLIWVIFRPESPRIPQFRRDDRED